MKHLVNRPHVQKLRRMLFNTDALPFYFLLAYLITLTVECFARRSLWQGLSFPFTNPFAFTINYGIILLSLLLTLFGRRRTAWISLISLFWIALGVTEFILLSFRVTPLTAVDFSILPSVLSILTIYLSPFQIGLIAVLLILSILGLTFLFLKVSKHRIALKKTLYALCSAVLGLLFAAVIGLQTEAISTTFPNLAGAYQKYGFAYCFSMSVFDKGIDQPEDYSQEAVDAILSEIPETDTEENDLPNVIVVQLESLFDVNRLTTVTFSENPLPTYTYLLDTYQSGLLTVPVIGAGTVNTEYEVLSGMSILHFGAGEYPYKSIIKEKATETIAYTLQENGLATHAIHNHQGTFYQRNEVYKNLGFSTFTPIEYMQNPTYNETKWAKDTLLTGEILSAMSSTSERDFVFAVSVQGHGKYPTDYLAKDGEITVTSGFEEDPERRSQYTYYVNQLRETDAFIRELYQAVMASDEPTVLVLYGDHFPALSIEDTDLSYGTTFDTEYVILSNTFATDNQSDRDLSAYQLYPTVMNAVNCDDGILNRLHRYLGEHEAFDEMLHTLSYDLLYGESYATDLTERYLPNENMRLGTRAILLETYEIHNETLYVKGQNFTPYSKIALNGITQENTVYLDENTLSLTLSFSNEHFSQISVQQCTDRGTVLSQTEALSIPTKYDRLSEFQ